MLRPVLIHCGPLVLQNMTFADFIWPPKSLDESCFHIFWKNNHFFLSSLNLLFAFISTRLISTQLPSTHTPTLMVREYTKLCILLLLKIFFLFCVPVVLYQSYSVVFCDDRNVLYLHCQSGGHYLQVAIEHLKCGRVTEDLNS